MSAGTADVLSDIAVFKDTVASKKDYAGDRSIMR
jgi:hypothetical protein